MKRIALLLFLSLVSLGLHGQTTQQIVVTILSGASLSAPVELRGCTPGAIEMPATWTTANLTFQAASGDLVTFKDMYDEFGTEVNVAAAASRYIRLTPSDWWTPRWLKVRSGTSGSAVNQGGDRVITIHCR